MSSQLGKNGVIRRDRAKRYGLHDHLLATAEARRLQAEMIAKGVRWAWTHARRALERLLNGNSGERTPRATTRSGHA